MAERRLWNSLRRFDQRWNGHLWASHMAEIIRLGPEESYTNPQVRKIMQMSKAIDRGLRIVCSNPEQETLSEDQVVDLLQTVAKDLETRMVNIEDDKDVPCEELEEPHLGSNPDDWLFWEWPNKTPSKEQVAKEERREQVSLFLFWMRKFNSRFKKCAWDKRIPGL